MSSGPSRPFVSVKFSPVGRTYTFLLPELALDAAGAAADAATSGAIRAGDAGRRADRRRAGARHGHARRARARRAQVARRPIPQLRVVRRATHDDVVTRLKQQQREQEAQRIAC